MRVWAERIARWSVAAVLLWAAVAKSIDVGALARTIRDFGLVWPGWEYTTATAILVAETAAGLLLLFKRPFGYALAAVLLIAFTAVIAYGMSIGLDIECGCLGPADHWAGATLRTSLVRNIVLIAALSIAWLLRNTRKRAAGVS